MACTTILVGKKASYDGSTMIARNDDGFYDVKKLVSVTKKETKDKYTSVISHLEIPLPSNPLRYTSTPSVNPSRGIWAANGINEKNVCMTATETVTSNPRVMSSDPFVRYQKAKNKKEKDIPGGIGEEDLVVLTIPYVNSAREGVIRLGSLLEKYGTYEANGIAFSDENEVWWLETIGGHHWIARKVEDDEYVIMPNQFGLDRFDFKDAYSDKKSNMCSSDLFDFVKDNNLYLGDLDNDNPFNPRLAFGSHSDADHVYNTPRAWYMGRYFNGNSYKWDGENADFNPMSDNIPWALKPDFKITVEDVKYILSSYYQGTPYNPFLKEGNPKKGIYRPIGISRTGVMAVLQVRNNVPSEIKGIEWVCFGCNAFNALIPVYANVDKMPKYLSDVSLDVSTSNFYWVSRLIDSLVDPYFGDQIQNVERYQSNMANEGHRLVKKFDKEYIESKDIKVIEKANEEICSSLSKIAQDTLNKVLLTASTKMKAGYSRADN